MSDLEKPILYVPASREDYTAKPGGGGTPDPLVPITRALIADLTGQIDGILGAAQVAQNTGTVAMIVSLREDAFAKSNRPNDLFERAGIPVSAARRIGELVVPAVPDGLRELRAMISDARTKLARFQISTIQAMTLWDINDVLEVGGRPLNPTEIGEAIEEGKRFRLEFFPWAANLAENQNIENAEHPFQDIDIEHSSGAVGRRVLYFRASSTNDVLAAASVPGVRHVGIEPEYASPKDYSPSMFLQIPIAAPPAIANVPNNLPTLGLFDSGVSTPLLEPYISGRIEYELPGDTDYMHGTFVAGLAAAGQLLNPECPSFPSDRSRIFDAVVLPKGAIAEVDLLLRIKDAVVRNPEIKVWNCSFGAANPNEPPEFGGFARELDKISDEREILFVVAAGNYNSAVVRGWPAEAGHFPQDRVSMPAEAVRALTVGALAPFDCAVSAGSPASYSRRGPGPSFICKPEVVHYGGGVNIDGGICGGMRSLLPADLLHEGVGTSFSTPIVSTIAANAWATLTASGRTANAALVKALIVHAAALNSVPYSPDDRNYFGFGMPTGSVDSMFCDPSAFTTLFEVELQRGVDWDKAPFPIPACLLTEDGSLRAEIVMTLSYSPPLADEFGDEYVQHEVEASFGSYDLDPEDITKRKHHGLVPLERPVGANTREVALLREALKYAPTKVYRAKFPRGRSAEQWRVKLSLTARKETVENVVQKAYLLVTLKGLEPTLPVYIDGLRAVPASWRVHQLVSTAAIRQRLR